MATRATLTIRDAEERFDLYRHFDGYPGGEHGVVRDLNAARKLSWPPPRFEAADFAAAVVAVMKQGPGAVFLTRDAERHADRAFHYDVSPEDSAIRLVVREFADRAAGALIRFEGTLDQAARAFDSKVAAPTRADLARHPAFAELGVDTAGNPCVFRNAYACPCGCEWTDDWSCAVDEDCADCGATIAPAETRWIGPQALYDLWRSLPEQTQA